MGKRGRPNKDESESSHSEEEEELYEQEELEIDEQGPENLAELIESKIQEQPENIKPAFVGLFSLHKKQEALDQEMEKEIHEIRRKYLKKAETLIQQTQKIVQGQIDGKSLLDGSTLLKDSQISKGLKGIKIEDYWKKVLLSSDLRTFFTERDEDILDFVDYLNIEDKGTYEYVLTLGLRSNPHLNNKKLTLTLKREDNGAIHVTADALEKKPGVSIDEDGFFSIYEETPDQLEPFFSGFLEFVEETYPRSLSYYFGFGKGDINLDNDLDMDEDDNDEHDDDDDDDDDDDEDEDDVKQMRKPVKKAKKDSKPAAKVEKPECKTQ